MAGQYRLEQLVGEGGMGRVWAGTRCSTGEPVALKFVKEANAAPELFERLLREARAACAVRHPGVVQVEDVLELEDGSPVLVMELLVGESLADRLAREGELALPETAAILSRVVSAVIAAHELGIVHRDLKPENVFLARSASGGTDVKVLDFGIAKLTAVGELDAATAGLTASGTLLGTPYYMAPEQVFHEKDVDCRADVWALGLVLYQCLTGLLPTRAENVGQVLKLVLTRRVWPLADAAPHLPADLCAVVDRMLVREREDRLTDLREVVDVLERHAGSVPAPPVAALPVRAPTPSATDRSAITDTASVAPALPSRSFDLPRGVALGALSGVVVAVVIAVLASVDSSANPDGPAVPPNAAAPGSTDEATPTPTRSVPSAPAEVVVPTVRRDEAVGQVPPAASAPISPPRPRVVGPAARVSPRPPSPVTTERSPSSDPPESILDKRN